MSLIYHVSGVDAVKSGEWSTWKPTWLCGANLQQSTVGVVGIGMLRDKLLLEDVNRLLYVGRLKVATDLPAEHVPLDTLLEQSDFIIVCCALTPPETQGIFNKATFVKMKNSAVFINVSRGLCDNQKDLHDALKSGEILAAGLDVTTPGLLSANSSLLRLKNCVVLPHIGSASSATRAAMAGLSVNNILARLAGTPMPAQLQLWQYSVIKFMFLTHLPLDRMAAISQTMFFRCIFVNEKIHILIQITSLFLRAQLPITQYWFR